LCFFLCLFFICVCVWILKLLAFWKLKQIGNTQQ
jgi:hypothetical protein